MTTTLILLAIVAGLLAVAFWWIRRNNLAVYPPGRGPLVREPLPTGCDLGARLMAATAVEGSPGTGPASGGGTTTSPAPPRRSKPPKKQPSRRDFFRISMFAATGGMLAAFGGASVGFLWPSLRGGFGAVLDIGDEATVRQAIAEGGGQYAYPAGRMYVVEFDPSVPGAEDEYGEITNGAPFMALYQKCVHLGCRVPWCASSHWFECPCHGSRYNNWGEYRFGPAPRGLDRFALRIEDGKVLVDTSTPVTGPSRQTAILNQAPEGPHCN